MRKFLELVGVGELIPVLELDHPLDDVELCKWLRPRTTRGGGGSAQDHSSTYFDHLVSIERVGPASDGRCRNMRGDDISAVTPCGVAELWLAALEQRDRFDVTLIAIGDGGNEIGMAMVRDQVREHIPRGALIACSLGADRLLVTGVSNWAGLALAALLYLLQTGATLEVCV
jgi:D-glutamate cyclase-like, C-terminal